MYRIIFITISAILWPMYTSANTPYKQQIKEELQKELKVVVSPRDSIRVLSDIFDLSTVPERPEVGWQLYKVSERTGNDKTTLDILRQLTNCYPTKDSMLAVIEEKMRSVPETPEQKESLLFVQMQRISSQARYNTEEQQLAGARQLLAEAHGDTNTDIYNQILQCYRICVYLGYSTKSTLAADYFDRLQKLLEQLPYKLTALQSFYYTQASLIYTTLELHDKAIEADRKLLQIIAQLEQEYTDKKRQYRNYDNSRYICYRRMLSNYPALSAEQIEKYYNALKELASSNPELKRDFDTQQRATMYYLLANKKYSEALPLIKKQFDYKYSRYHRSQILRAMCTAAEACADSATWINALSEYICYLEDATTNSSAEAYRELQIRYDLSQLKAENARLEVERLDNQVKADRLMLGIALVATAVLVILIIILANLYRRRDKELRNSKTDTDERD